MIIDQEKCNGCQKCVKDCFVEAIKINDNKAKINKRKCILCGHCIAICPQNAAYSDEYDMSEVIEHSEKDFKILSENLLNFIKFRRTIRQFKNKPVEPEKIQKIIEAGRFTQTAGNLQDLTFIIVQSKISELRDLTIKSLKALSDHILSDKNNQNTVFKKYAKMWKKMYEDHQTDPQGQDKLFCNAPALILVAGNIEINAGLASSNMELITNTLGLGTMFSGFFIRAANSNKEIYELLQIPENKQIYTCMTIGYPDVKYLRTVPRKKAHIIKI